MPLNKRFLVNLDIHNNYILTTFLLHSTFIKSSALCSQIAEVTPQILELMRLKNSLENLVLTSLSSNIDDVSLQ